MDKAVQAELSAKKEVAESRHLLREMENEKSKAIAESGNSRARLLECETKLRNVELLLKESASDKDRTTEKLQHVTSALTHEESRRAAIETDLEDTKLKESGLRSDLSTVREELQQLRKSLAAAQAAAPPAPECSDVKSSIKAPSPTSTSGNDSTNHSLVDETVAMLQRELKEARSSNDELKEALGNLLAENDRNKRSFSSSDPVTESDTLQSAPKRLQSRDADSTPLFYAIEKQAELKTARDEITRLANLLSFVQSEKSEAEEAMILMKQRMEEAENRMKRYQKFGRASENGGTGGDNINHANNGSDSGLVNIEYLKNIMLRYLNAHTVKERKSLVPAIGAVLELTPDELHSALLNVEQGASLSGVGSSIFETLSTKLGGQL
jgi:predicted  nucleic acid-binding Zn-ribbon protein